MKLHLGIDLIYAAKRWPEPDEWGRQVTQRWGLKYVQFCFDLLDPRSSPEARKTMAAKVREASAKYGFEVQSAFIGVGAYAADQGLEFVCWEPTPIGREMLIHLDQALEESGAEEVYLFPELIHPFEFPEDTLLEELDESYEFLRQYVGQPTTA